MIAASYRSLKTRRSRVIAAASYMLSLGIELKMKFWDGDDAICQAWEDILDSQRSVQTCRMPLDISSPSSQYVFCYC